MAPADLHRTARWAGLGPGDPVQVSGTRIRGATWKFVAHVANAETGEEWVEGVGGRAGAECPGGIGFANIACNTRENDGEHDQDGRGKGCVLVRGPEQLRDAREGALRLARLR